MGFGSRFALSLYNLQDRGRHMYLMGRSTCVGGYSERRCGACVAHDDDTCEKKHDLLFSA